ncbi:MAG TPA: ABC transporter ATP-binding protein [Thermoproteota archaeon]|nr:ABC transporter ATP-binding protein [Thermoproteota archaeon]
MAENPVVSLRDVAFSYQGGLKPALKGINFELRAGESIVITGPSGSGKTSLARLITGLIPNSYPGELSGSAVVFGEDVSKSKIYALAQRVGFVLQNPENQLFALTVEDDVAFGPENLALPRQEIKSRVDWGLSTTGLEDQRQRPPFELSGGFQQRAAIAGVLAMKPRLLVLDEPASSLDSLAARNFVKFLARLRSELGVTTLIIEQRLELFYNTADRIVVMQDGSIAVDATPLAALDSCLKNNLQVNYPLSYLFWKTYGRDISPASETPPSEPMVYVDSIRRRIGENIGQD